MHGMCKIVLHRHLLSRHIESNPIVPYLFYSHGSLIRIGHFGHYARMYSIDPTTYPYSEILGINL